MRVKLSIVTLLSCLVVLQSCNKSQLRSVQALEVRSVNSDMREVKYRVFYYGSLTLYQSYYQLDSVVNQVVEDSTGNVKIKGDLKSSNVRSRYFVFHRDSSFGYNFNPYDSSENNIRVDVAPMLRSIKVSYLHDFSLRPDSVVWTDNKERLKEVYRIDQEPGLPNITLTLYFSKRMNNVRESLSPALDSAKSAKLYKYEIKFDSFIDTNHRSWPASNDVTEMSELESTDTAGIMLFFKKYKESVQVAR